MDKRLSMGNCYDEHTKKNTVLKGANKMNITNQVYDRMVKIQIFAVRHIGMFYLMNSAISKI